MLNGLYSAAAGMIAQQTRIDSLANDIATRLKYLAQPQDPRAACPL